jgi:hypothetical protein
MDLRARAAFFARRGDSLAVYPCRDVLHLVRAVQRRCVPAVNEELWAD